MRDELFRPSALARHKACPGALALESTLPVQQADNEDATEGRMLHELLADPAKPRTYLNPEQLEAVDAAEKMDKEFIAMIRKRHKLS